MRAALEPLELPEWIDIDENFVPELEIKTKLLKESYSDVFAALPGTEAAQQEILDLLLDHLLQYFPQHYQRQDTKIENLKTGQVWDLNEFKDAPILLAGQLVQEDLFLLQPGSEGYILTAALACFPLFWRLPEKFGRPIFQIHQKVPGFEEKMRQPVDIYFEHLKTDSPGIRIAWGITPTPLMVVAWWEPEEGWEKVITPENAGDHLWLRTEHQTFRRLPKSGGIVFGIHSYVDPISSLKDQPEIRRNLATVIRQMSPQTQAYRGMEPFLSQLLAYLEQ